MHEHTLGFLILIQLEDIKKYIQNSCDHLDRLQRFTPISDSIKYCKNTYMEELEVKQQLEYNIIYFSRCLYLKVVKNYFSSQETRILNFLALFHWLNSPPKDWHSHLDNRNRTPKGLKEAFLHLVISSCLLQCQVYKFHRW